jgi:hypothetical protein
MKTWILKLLVASCGLGLACASPAPPPALTPCSDGGSAPKVQKIRSQANSQTVRVSATVVASEDEAPSHARHRAEVKALREAVEFVAGVRVKSGFLSFEQMRGADSQMLIQRLNSTRVDAFVMAHQIVREEASAGDFSRMGYCYGIVLDATVLDRRQNSDPDFEVHLSLGRDRLVSGDPVQVSIKSSRDARIYLIGIYENAMAVLLPNGIRKDTRVKAGETLVFPDAKRGEDKKLLRAEVPEGKAETTETLLVIAIRGDAELVPQHSLRNGRMFETVEAKGAGTLLQNYLAQAMSLPPDQWAFAQIAYEIRR